MITRDIVEPLAHAVPPEDTTEATKRPTVKVPGDISFSWVSDGPDSRGGTATWETLGFLDKEPRRVRIRFATFKDAYDLSQFVDYAVEHRTRFKVRAAISRVAEYLENTRENWW